VETLPWTLLVAPEAYYLEGALEDPPDNDDDLDYEPMEVGIKGEEAIQRDMAVSKAEESAKWIQRSQ
jgi:hypothetical protein